MTSTDQWQPIETAPKDGEWVIIYDDQYRHSHASYLISHWHGSLKVWAGRSNSQGRFATWDEATHWMPLPAPPEQGT